MGKNKHSSKWGWLSWKTFAHYAGILSTIAIVLIGWLIILAGGSYRIAFYVILFGYMLLVINYLVVDWLTPVISNRVYMVTVASRVAILLLNGYCYAVVGIASNALEAPESNFIVSAIFLIFPIALILCSILMHRMSFAYYVSSTILTMITVVAIYLDYVIFELLLDIPSIFFDHINVLSRLHFYDVLMGMFLMIIPLVSALGLVRIAGVLKWSTKRS